MSRAIIPIASLSRRLPEAGRIRIGTSEKAKSRKGNEFDRPVKLDRFRFTSSDPAALAQVAAIYGGEVRPWNHQRAAAGQYELITDAREIRVALPPDPLGGSPVYELWEGGGCQRRCDGETCDIIVTGPDGPEPQQVPCLCDAKGEMSCKVTTHLSVLLPEIRFVGLWRLTSHGWNAAQELPGMVDLIRSLQDRGIVRGVLRVEARHSVTGGQTRDYMVPVLGVDESVEALAAGQARLGSLPPATPERMELGAGSSGEVEQSDDAIPLAELGESVTPAAALSPDTHDDEIVDAEIVEAPQAPPESAGTSAPNTCSRCGEPFGDAALVKGGEGESRFIHAACGSAGTESMEEGQQRFIFAELRKRSITGPQRFEWATGLLGREVTTFKDLTKADADVLIAGLRAA